MKERILVVEDDLISIICALSAFEKNESIEDVVAATSLIEAIRQIDVFRPTLALLDIHIIGGLGTAVAKILETKNIPYLYVTGVGPHIDHNNIEAIEIQDKNFKALERYNCTEKKSEIWKNGYLFIKNL